MFGLLAVLIGRAALVQLAVDAAAIVGAVKIVLDTKEALGRLRSKEAGGA